jgi:hypothetical protein
MTGGWLGSIFRELSALRNNARALAAALPRLGAAAACWCSCRVARACYLKQRAAASNASPVRTYR